MYTCSLYHSLSNVYYPLLGIDQQPGASAIRKQQRAVDPKLEELLLDVQAGLGKLVRAADGSQVCSCEPESSCAAAPSHQYLHQTPDKVSWLGFVQAARMHLNLNCICR